MGLNSQGIPKLFTWRHSGCIKTTVARDNFKNACFLFNFNLKLTQCDFLQVAHERKPQAYAWHVIDLAGIPWVSRKPHIGHWPPQKQQMVFPGFYWKWTEGGQCCCPLNIKSEEQAEKCHNAETARLAFDFLFLVCFSRFVYTVQLFSF